MYLANPHLFQGKLQANSLVHGPNGARRPGPQRPLPPTHHVNRAPNCICRELFDCDVMLPHAAAVGLRFGALNSVRLVAVKASARHWKVIRSLSGVFLMSETSRLLAPSWRRLLNCVENTRT